jgi:hypothetical protein
VTLRAFSRLAGAAVVLALALVGCAERSDSPRGGGVALDSLPGAALTERAQRDSARVATLVVAYYDALARDRLGEARALFFPESIRVATPEGGVVVEGRSGELEARLLADSGAPPVRRIVVLRRANTELLDNTFRETWWVRWVPERDDSAQLERRIHVLQQLGEDARWLGRMHTGE